MNPQTYSREALRAMPVEMRKQYLKQFIQSQGFINSILASARNGDTSMMIQYYNDNKNWGRGVQPPPQFKWQATPTAEELREALLEIFPDSTITYEEKWIQTSPGKQELKKGLIVDWS